MLIGSTLLTAIGLTSSVHAWGGLGHKTLANVALQFLTEDTLTGVEAVLAADGHKKTPHPSIVDIATWADDWAHSKGGAFSKEFHYIDAQDDPPFECNVDLDRDCSGEGGCVVKAIANYTRQLINPSRNINDTADALKFLVHFIGDITQPLHAESKARGGNDIHVTWQGHRGKNLHGVWDTDIITALAGEDDKTNRDQWTETIVDEIKNGNYKDLVPEWLSCTDVNDALNCALRWAIDSNSFICSYVLKTDPAGRELSGTYYRGAAPIVQEQIAKGGVRLAVWLNQLFGSGEAGRLPTPAKRLVVQDRAL
ncbi:hypothetical protein M407DRAFT_246091 [Tulasnella calospora MUT 4182]|uniref:S1/P1 nuclease n=1 Tax=Tulasnella calospora MUT 4182 TaxID=1051891 RepID=A0A0C3Q7T5_9AGAM|nr:hypothetical protein M407DRAFT_246091 [Tulasnella calospora MUT 4182]